jgi:putative transposase
VLQLEILALRHQLGVLQRSVKRSKLTPADRLLWAWLRTVWQDWQSGVFIMKDESCHSPRLAPQGLSPFLEVEDSTWQAGAAGGSEGNSRTDSHDEPRKSALGRSPDLRRTAPARHRDRRNQRQPIHGPPQETAIPDLENVPRESRKKYGVGGLLRRADDPVPDLSVFLVLAHERRRIVHFAVTAHPTAEGTAQPLREAFPWDTARAICYGTAIGSWGRILSTR